MQVNAVYSDGSTKDVTSEIVTDPTVGSDLEAGGHDIVISYSEDEVTVLDTVNIKVYPDSPFAMNLEINPLPSKVGDTLDWSNVHADLGWMQDGLGSLTVSPPELTCDIELPYTFEDTALMGFTFTYSGKYGYAQTSTTIHISE